MLKRMVLPLILVFCLALMAEIGVSGVLATFEVTGFPENVAGGKWDDTTLLTSYQRTTLEVYVDMWKEDTSLIFVVTGFADATRYNKDHDSKNPALAMGRGIIGAKILELLGADDPTRIYLMPDEYYDEKGPECRGFRIQFYKSQWATRNDLKNNLAEIRGDLKDLK
ncbi:MAG: hypothetical protein KKC05_01250, partial [Nanoarchaeota archaeon]|nr:hypothetical protein [Nanoarchaeota archaeon]